ncbi:(d)CMP kinase [Bacillus sp. Marseille-P3661]|uniref:(d)CMP kinase n=1 Tax=Bacillus sp. Marseille-P3661 TaxID=1936234 RepID=UPI000C816F38|nr:(d)CMP kinase [Bacillus sp. Marseille-P3661]
MKKISVAIDGPAAAGKSTVAKKVAEKMSYIYIDTGAMYRAITYKALTENIDINDETTLVNMVLHTHIELKSVDEGQRVYIDGIDVTENIRSNEVTNKVSIIARYQGIREHMVKKQQEMAVGGGIVMDGRDIGTHVLPSAELKIFMVASVEERAKRRYEENIQKGFQANLEKLKEEIALRDKLDSERTVAPLRKAEDAIEINTTKMSIEEVVEKIIQLIQERV